MFSARSMKRPCSRSRSRRGQGRARRSSLMARCCATSIVPSARGPQRVVLGLNTLSDYLAYSPHFGAVPGRFANRIANGRFTLDGVAYQLDRKPGDKHTLHGGPHGFGHRVWKLGAHDDSSVELTLESPDGDSGFPGALTATCVYRLVEPATLRVELSAVVGPADHRQSHQAHLFQPRRLAATFSTMKSICSRTSTRPPTPSSFRPGRFAPSPARLMTFAIRRPVRNSTRNEIRHEFRRRPPARRRRSCADRDGAFAR